MFFDLDGFKAINDTLGHATGDQVLRLVAKRLTNLSHPILSHPVNCMARVSGDEFVVVIEGQTHLVVAQLAQNIISELVMPFSIDGNLLGLSASMGISFFPQDAKDVHELLLRADRAMYEVKRSGKNGFQFYKSNPTVIDEQRQFLERELRLAQVRGELSLEFQPIFNMHVGETVCLEALVRWKHAQFGKIEPRIFIAIAEECGLISTIGEWVLKESLASARRWWDNGFSHIRVAVNVSLLQLMQTQFVEVVRLALEGANLPPNALELEVTEGIDLRERSQVMNTLIQLHELGVLLSLDDFGTGFASLSHLNDFPVQVVKIDKVFVADLVGTTSPARNRYVRTLIAAMVTVASELGLDLVVEGIETRAQYEELLLLGCRRGQGYYFSKPMPEADLLMSLNRLSLAAGNVLCNSETTMLHS